MSIRGPSLQMRSVNNREISLAICERARQSPNRKSRRMTFCAHGLTGIIQKLPSDGPAFGPARSFRPDHQHLPIHVRRDGRMLSIVTFAGRYDGCRNLERNGFDGIEVNLGSTLPSGTYALSAFAQIGRAHGTRVQFPRTHGRIVKRDSLVCGYE